MTIMSPLIERKIN